MSSKYVKSKVKINKLVIKQINQASITALEQTADALLGEVVAEQIIPFDEGTLQNEGTYVNSENSDDGHVQIVSSTPYARRLYYHPEYNFQTLGNKNAKGKWFDDWMPGGKYADFTPNAFSILLKKLGGL